MKINIEWVKASCETEISIRCSENPDEKTREMISRLQFFMEGIVGYKDKEMYRLSLQDVYYIDSVEEKTFLYLEREVYESQMKLYEWENQLSDTSFVRISKSTILNTDKLQSVRPLLGGKMEAVMSNGEMQIVNRHYIPSFRRKFGI